MERMPLQTGNVPESLVKFLMLRKDKESIPLVDTLWMADVTRWEEIYQGFGTAIEERVIGHLPTASASMKRSIARSLAKNGTTRSIPALEAARSDADSETVMLIERALAAIRSRDEGS